MSDITLVPLPEPSPPASWHCPDCDAYAYGPAEWVRQTAEAHIADVHTETVEPHDA